MGAAGNLSPEIAARIEAAAQRLVDDLTRAPIGSPSFERAVRSVDRIGEREIRTATAVTAQFGERRISALQEVLDDDAPMARHVHAVKALARTFAKASANPSPSGRDRLETEVARHEQELRALARALDDDRSTLMSDNALLDQYERGLTLQARSLEQLVELTRRMDELMSAYGAALRSTDAETANRLETEAVYAIRQRRRDVTMHFAVATQGLTTLSRIQQSNLEVIRALRSASSLTLAALRTAGLALRALDSAGSSAEAWRDLLASLEEADQMRKSSLASAGRRRLSAS